MASKSNTKNKRTGSARDETRTLTVITDAEPPELMPSAARALLAILVELTTIPVLDVPGEEGLQ